MREQQPITAQIDAKAADRSASSANAGYGARNGARVTHGPAAGIDLGYEVADDAVEEGWRFEIDGVPAIRHHRESRRWDGALHQQRRRQARPVLVTSLKFTDKFAAASRVTIA